MTTSKLLLWMIRDVFFHTFSALLSAWNNKIWITIDDKNSFEHVKLFTIYGCIVLWPRNKSHKPNENDPMCISSENVILFRFVHPLHWLQASVRFFSFWFISCAFHVSSEIIVCKMTNRLCYGVGNHSKFNGSKLDRFVVEYTTHINVHKYMVFDGL